MSPVSPLGALHRSPLGAYYRTPLGAFGPGAEEEDVPPGTIVFDSVTITEENTALFLDVSSCIPSTSGGSHRWFLVFDDPLISLSWNAATFLNATWRGTVSGHTIRFGDYVTTAQCSFGSTERYVGPRSSPVGSPNDFYFDHLSNIGFSGGNITVGFLNMNDGIWPDVPTSAITSFFSTDKIELV